MWVKERVFECNVDEYGWMSVETNGNASDLKLPWVIYVVNLLICAKMLMNQVNQIWVHPFLH